MLQGSLNPSHEESPRWSNQCPVSQMEKPKQSPNVLPNHTCYGPNQVSVLSLLKQAQAPPCRARSSFRSFYQMWFQGPQNYDTPSGVLATTETSHEKSAAWVEPP